MIQKAISRANRRVTVSAAAGLLAGSYFLSALLGLLRDRLLAAHFGIAGTLDAYFAAFSLPDLMFYVLVSGALTVTLLPVLTDRLMHYNKKSAWDISSSTLNFLAFLTLLASVFIFIFADPLMWAVAPKFDQARHELAVSLTRILAINPFLFSISSVFATIQQAFGRFFFYSLAPLLYNLGIIFGIIFLSPTFGITGVAWGVVLGAVAQLLIQAVGLIGTGFVYRARIFWKNHGFRKVLRLIIPRSVDEGVEHLQAVIERAIASGLAVGSIAAYQYAFNIKNVPITLIGTAIATAAFPKISERAASKRSDLVNKELSETFRVMLWLLTPTAALTIILRGYIVRLVLGFGDITVAGVLGWFAIAIVFQALLRIVARAFYAFQDTKTPLYSSIAMLVLIVPLALYFVNIFAVKGLAMAQSLVAAVEVFILLAILRRRIGRIIPRSTYVAFGKMTAAAAAMLGVTYSMVRYVFPLLATDVGFFTLAPKFSAIVAASLLTYLAIGYVLRLKEARVVAEKTLSFVFRRVTIE